MVSVSSSNCDGRVRNVGYFCVCCERNYAGFHTNCNSTISFCSLTAARNRPQLMSKSTHMYNLSFFILKSILEHVVYIHTNYGLETYIYGASIAHPFPSSRRDLHVERREDFLEPGVSHKICQIHSKKTRDWQSTQTQTHTHPVSSSCRKWWATTKTK